MRRTVVAAVAFATCIVAVAPSPARAGDPSAVGWWTRRAGAAPLGDGAFELASGLQGDESVAAFRIDAVPVTATAVRLVVTAQSAASADTDFIACRATEPWEPADAGAWDDAPVYDCGDAATARPVGTGAWAVDLLSFSSGGAPIDVVLVPAPAEVVPGLGVRAVFTTVFTRADVVTESPAATTSTTTATASGGGRAAVTPGGTPPVAPVVPLPAPYAAPLVVTTVTTTAAAPTPTTMVAMIEAPTFDDEAGGGDARPWARLLLLVPLSAAAGFGATVVRSLARRRGAPALLGS